MRNDLSDVAVDKLIIEIRGQKIILDSDLAALYEVETRQLNQAIKRNKERFSVDFMFQLTNEEFQIMKSQFAISSWCGDSLWLCDNSQSFPGTKAKILNCLRIYITILGWLISI